jgi:hypothetical protein
MMNFLQGASDDQVALIGCLVALIGSAGLMYVSFFVGPASRRRNDLSNETVADTVASARNVIELPVEPSRERAA